MRPPSKGIVPKNLQPTEGRIEFGESKQVPSDSTKDLDKIQFGTLERTILSTAKGGGMIFIGQLFSYVFRFLIGFILARFLGASEYGLYNLALSTVFVVSIFTGLGLDTGLVRYISVYINQRDEKALRGTLLIGLGIPLILGILAGFGLFFFAQPIAYQIYNEPELAPHLRFISLVVPFLTLNSMIGSAIQGFNKMQYVVISEHILQSVVRLLLLLFFALLGLNAIKALSAYSITAIVVFFVYLFFLNQLFSIMRNPREAKFETKQLISFSLPVYLSKTVNTIGGNIQTILLGTYSTLVDVGIFAVTDQIGIIGRLFHNSIVSASRPVISALFDSKDFDQLKRFYQATSKWTFTLYFPIFLLVLMFPSAILSIFGKSYVGGVTALVILAWANLINIGTGVCGAMLDMSGYTTLKFVNSIVTVSATLVINFILIPIYGLIGAAIAVLASNTIINLLRIIEVFFLFRLQPFNLSYIKPIVAGSLAVIISLVVDRIFPSDENVVFILVNVSILLISYVCFVFLLGISEEDRFVLSYVRNKARAILTRNRLSA